MSYRKKSKIGQDASANVYRARMVRSGGHNPPVFESGAPFIAIKQICISQRMQLDMVMDEIAIMSQCNRPNIVDFYDVIWQVGDDYIWIVMEYADCGSLTDLIYFSHDLREDHIALLCCEVGSF
jgi:serine/threonine protein kinase